MLFNSLGFAIFLPIVFFLYWFVTNRNLKSQNILLVIASYYFYACWDYRFLFLLIFSTLLDYFSGLQIAKSDSKTRKQIWLFISIFINLGFLGVFKYYNFFVNSFADALSIVGVNASFTTLNVIIPVGISFYTFHGLSYIIDVYYGKIPPEKDFIVYTGFVCFFPLLVAGPIERATHLLPQIKKKREFDYNKAVDGMRQILWGLFKKVVIADNCAEYANVIFNNSGLHSGSELAFGAFFFTIQIYCDFSGYSDIALGTARLFGIELLRNFAFPYFSRDIAEFWRRWHISLSNWFRDYLYIPLGGSRGGIWMKIRNTFIIFLVSGFWHGANWTFIIWGALNAIYFLPLLVTNMNRNNLVIVAQGKLLPSFREVISIGITFCLTIFAWIFFRANNVDHAFSIIKEIFSSSFFNYPHFHRSPIIILILIVVFFIIEWLGREKQYALAGIGVGVPQTLRWATYLGIIACLFYYAGSQQDFIYFQF
jgi:alginate O-acetyltransferase complex protein AlgI